MCRTRTETITEFFFPIAMTQAKTEMDVSFTEDNLDFCCQQFARGEQSFEEACVKFEIVLYTENIWDG